MADSLKILKLMNNNPGFIDLWVLNGTLLYKQHKDVIGAPHQVRGKLQRGSSRFISAFRIPAYPETTVPRLLGVPLLIQTSIVL